MRLTELNPHWMEIDGARVGILLRCPHCQDYWLSCFFIPMPHIAGEDYHECQYALFRKTLPDISQDEMRGVVPCRRDYAWQVSPPVAEATFENLSVTPSLDASRAGHWHGFITNGEIR